MFYESKNSLSADIWKTESDTDFSFPAHLHGSFELITVTEGSMSVTVDKRSYTVRSGDALLIFPNQVHSLTTEEHSRHFLCIFSPKTVQAYSKVYLSKIPRSNLFHPDTRHIEALMALGDSPVSEIELKGHLYTLCGEFDRGAEYLDRAEGSEGLLSEIFRFVETEYGGDCSLEALSARTSFHYGYLSRYFKQRTGHAFTDYVNRYRVNEACYLLRNGERSVLSVAYDCGFNSLRSFNRNFKKITGATPAEYRQRGVKRQVADSADAK